MILELADIRIQPGQNAAFEAAITHAAQTVLVQAKGAQGYKINRGIENPERYVLQIFGTRWKTTRWASASRSCSRSGAPSLAPSLPRPR
jgi:heme-degrading monooxygenase HmoA